EERRVLLDLAAAERAQAGDQVAGEATAADDQPEDLALRLDDAMAGNERSGCDDHGSPSVVVVAGLGPGAMPVLVQVTGLAAACRARGARAAVAEEVVGIEPGGMAVAPVRRDGVVADEVDVGHAG